MEGPTVAASSSTAEQASSAATGSKRTSTSSRHAFKVGERVHAKWIQNGSYYPATIKEVRPATGKVLVDWEDGDTIDRAIAICDCFKMEPAAPQNRETIDAACFVQDLPNKGRCLFTRQQLRSGDVVFCEAATLVAIESRHQELWDALVEMHEADAFELGTWSFVYAALLSLLELGPKELQVVLDKFVPEGENEVISKDVHRVFSEELQFPQKFLKKEHKVAVVKQASGSSSPSSRGAAGGGKTQFQFPGGKQMTKTLVQTLINAWRYNSFGHHTEEGLVLYNRISMCSHACDPSCCWTYGDDDSFVLRARVALEPSAELTISYLQDEDLLKSTSIRREKLENWKFTCGCVRCNLKVDICRGYRCLKCRVGAHYYKENIEDMTYNSTSTETAQSAQKPAAKRKKLCAADDYYDAPRVKPTTRESTVSTAFGRQSQQLYFRDQMLACEARYALAKEEKKNSSSSSAASSFRSRSTGTGGGGGNSSASSSSSSAGKAARGAGAGNLIKANKTSGSSTTSSGAVMKGLAGEKPGTPPAAASSREKETVRPGDQLTACDVCGEPCTDFAAKQCLNLEPEYVQRIEALEKTNIQDIELVYNATLDFFHEHHWCVFVCEQILSEYYTETKRDVKAAMTHQRNRITFHERVFGRPSFIWAGDLEALADNLQKQIKEQEQKEAAAAASQQGQILGAGGGVTTQNANNSPPSSQQSADLLKNPLLKSNKRSSSATSNNSSPGGVATGVGSPSAASGSKKNTVKKQLSRLSECLAMYRKSQSQYAVLCGASHPYSLSAQNKWHAVQHKINSIANSPTKGTGAGAGTPKPK